MALFFFLMANWSNLPVWEHNLNFVCLNVDDSSVNCLKLNATTATFGNNNKQISEENLNQTTEITDCELEQKTQANFLVTKGWKFRSNRTPPILKSMLNKLANSNKLRGKSKISSGSRKWESCRCFSISSPCWWSMIKSRRSIRRKALALDEMLKLSLSFKL